ncbi:amino acid permease-domain-containing protein [Nemania diffusa]|nr:amino acid permease-domain-containing protein [Nemania diffusa]
MSGSSDGFKSTRPLRRGLYPRHIFVISIGAVIGVGFYTRTSVIYGLGGKAGVIYSFAFLGMLAFMVGRCLALMLDQWPVPGALFVLVEKFVDRQVGQAVGPFYWVAYVFAFAVQTTSINSFNQTLGLSDRALIGINIASLLIPILFNLMDLRYFRKIELVLGYLKLIVILTIIILTNADSSIVNTNPFDKPQSKFRSYFLTLVPCIFLASFTFVGIEVVGATAQEAIVPGHSPPSSARSLTLDGPREDSHNYSYTTDSVASPFKRAALFSPIVSVIVYLWGGWIVTETIPPDHPS